MVYELARSDQVYVSYEVSNITPISSSPTLCALFHLWNNTCENSCRTKQLLPNEFVQA